MADSKGVVQSNPMNNTHGKHNHNYSSFPDSLAYKHYMTCRFGDYSPSFVMDGVPKDEITLQAKHLIDSLSLNAPFKGSIRKITESFMVPNIAILPFNWEKIYAQPANGDDVPKDANCVIQNFPALFKESFMTLYTKVYNGILNLPDSGATANQFYPVFNSLVRLLIYGEFFLSAGSLPAVCGYHSNNFLEIYADNRFRSYDSWFNLVVSHAFAQSREIRVSEPIGSSTRVRYFHGLSTLQYDLPTFEPFRALWELFRENPNCRITNVDEGIQGYDPQIADLKSMLQDVDADDYLFPNPETPEETFTSFLWRLPITSSDSDDLTDMSASNFNLTRILSYQLVCAHYYTNSAIDFVYSAELFREYIGSFMNHLCTPFHGGIPRFSWNGVSCVYDFLSGACLKYALLWWYYSPDVDPLNSRSDSAMAALAALFGFRKSLRFGDYFVGSRPRPLAPINTDVSVNNNLVSVIDVTRNIQAQRFANSVMRSRSKIENYIEDLFGKRPAPDYHNPFFLSRQAEFIYGDEVQNTAESQVTEANSRTSLFKSNNGQFMFTFHNDDAHPCTYIQIVSFDVKRAYTKSIDRQFMHLDRFDMFNPDFQYIGDQPVYGLELGYTFDDYVNVPAVFGYQGRDMEYKQRFDVASGGFVEYLPGWCLTDQARSVMRDGRINSDFIRSFNTELDPFFLALDGYSLGSYFHFILVAINNVSAKRAMAVDPQILE